MTREQIKAEREAIIHDAAKARINYDLAMAHVKHRRKLLSIQCQHEWRTRSIMGRDTVTECIHCDCEYPG